jgi:protein phosphatase
MQLSYIYSSRVGLKRSLNEDFVDVFEQNDGILSVVCDGLGGNNAGEIASQLAVQTIATYFLEHTELDVLERIESSIFAANTAIINESAKKTKLNGMATTVVMLFLNQNRAVWGHVGDSRIYYWDDENIIQITKDHSLVQKLLDSGSISKKQAENHPHKNVIIRALGEKNELVIDFDQFNFDKNRRWKFFLCTDGVSNFVTKEELQNLLEVDDLNLISKSLSALIDQRGAPDNYSYVILSNQV